MYTHAIIGIWGFGVVGKSALRFFAQHATKKIIVFDKKYLLADEQNLVDQAGGFYEQQTDENSIKHFLSQLDYVLVSPGIDTRAYKELLPYLLTELDLFAAHWRNPLIAITGTVGKTTTTALLGELLSYHRSTVVGGNIGLGMLDLVAQQHNHNDTLAVLELSSFQLSDCTHFQPDIALITNIYHNHLDRHGTFDDYIKAKCKIFLNQKTNQHLVLPLETAQLLHEHGHDLNSSALHLISDALPDQHLLQHFKYQSITYCDGTMIVHQTANQTSKLPLSLVPALSYLHNWLLVLATLKVLNNDWQPEVWQQKTSDLLNLPAICQHRLEKVCTIDDIEFYNDSKSTIMESTLQAVGMLRDKPLILLLGGISKGVNRANSIKELHGAVKSIICFGTEAQQLEQACAQAAIAATACTDLSDALNSARALACAGDRILLSPGGASFDLFTNYQERGKYFKRLLTEKL